MRLTTLGFLAALGMTLTSATVWSLTQPKQASASGTKVAIGPSDPKVGDPTIEPDEPNIPTAKIDKSTFVSGKALMLEGRLSQAKLLAGQANEAFLFVDVRSELDPQLDALGGAASPINLAIVIDRSGSMVGQRERNAFDAAEGMIRHLREGDTVSVIAYADEAEILIPVTTLDALSRERIINDLRLATTELPTGHTCISCGIELGKRTLERRRAGISRMLLLSDGEANRGTRDEQGIRVLARQARNEGVTISSIGVDVDYNEKLMSAIARESNGRHYFSETGSNLGEIFEDELQSLIRTVATEGKLVVELAPGVRLAEVFDRSYQQVDRRVIVPLGSFAAGEEKTLLMRLDVPSGPVGERAIANVTLTYSGVAGTGAALDSGECFGELAAELTSSAREVSPIDAIVLARLTRAETSRTLTSANDLFAQGRASEAEALLADQLDKISSNKRSAGDAAGSAGFVDPFDRNLDDDFARQTGAISKAKDNFADAAESSPEPAAAAPAKKQIRENAASADAFAL